MTAEEAIKIFESWAQSKYKPTHDAAVMAISALRAHQTTTKLDRSRWEGCDWCNQRYCDNCFWQIKIKDSSKCERCIDKSEWHPLVSYCSNCGKPLTEEAWAEMERMVEGADVDI